MADYVKTLEAGGFELIQEEGSFVATALVEGGASGRIRVRFPAGGKASIMVNPKECRKSAQPREGVEAAGPEEP